MEGLYIGIGSALAGAALVYLKTRSKYQHVKRLLKDLVAAIDDDELTGQEAAQLLQDARELIA